MSLPYSKLLEATRNGENYKEFDGTYYNWSYKIVLYHNCINFGFLSENYVCYFAMNTNYFESLSYKGFKTAINTNLYYNSTPIPAKEVIQL